MKTRVGILAATAAALVTAGLAQAAEGESNGLFSRWDSAPVIKGDGWELKFGGRVQLDYAFVDADIAGAGWNEGELRRLRLEVVGKIGGNFKYKVELNTNSSGNVNLEDGYVQWAPTGGAWNVRAGQFKTPNALDEQTSSRFLSMLERAGFTDAFEFNRRLGVSLNAAGDNYTLSAGIFGDNVNIANQQKGYAVAARGTLNPVKTDTTLVHLAVSVRYRSVGAMQGDIQYRQRPVSHIPGRIISTGAIAGSDVFVGAEAATIHKNFWVAGEYGVTFANCSAAAACADPTLQGGYGEVGVVFGGRKTYKGGKWDRPEVNDPVTKGGMGALAFVARFDTIDLSDSGVNGGSYNATILGADWWATKYTRLGVNLFKLDADLGTSISGLDASFASLVTAAAPREDVTGAIFRAQLDF